MSTNYQQSTILIADHDSYFRKSLRDILEGAAHLVVMEAVDYSGPQFPDNSLRW
jgi:hypothetical protein